MRYSSVKDMHSVNAVLDGIGAVGKLGKHSASDHSAVDKVFRLGYRDSSDKGGLIVDISVKSLDIGKEYQLVRTECLGYGACRIIGIDVIGIEIIIKSDGRYDGKEIVIEKIV